MTPDTTDSSTTGTSRQWFRSLLASYGTSKTIWFNTAILVVAIIPPITEWIQANGFEATAALAMLNVLGKHLSALIATIKEDLPKVERNENGNSDPGSTASSEDGTSSTGGTAGTIGKTLSLLIVIGLVVCLPSCGHTISYNPDDGLYWSDPETGRDIQIIVHATKF